MTFSELAEAADKSIQFLSMLERGQRSASLETVARIADALSVSPAELLAEGEKAKASEASRGEDFAVLMDGLTEEQVKKIFGIVKQVRDLLLTARGRGPRPAR